MFGTGGRGEGHFLVVSKIDVRFGTMIPGGPYSSWWGFKITSRLFVMCVLGTQILTP